MLSKLVSCLNAEVESCVSSNLVDMSCLLSCDLLAFGMFFYVEILWPSLILLRI